MPARRARARRCAAAQPDRARPRSVPATVAARATGTAPVSAASRSTCGPAAPATRAFAGRSRASIQSAGRASRATAASARSRRAGRVALVTAQHDDRPAAAPTRQQPAAMRSTSAGSGSSSPVAGTLTRRATPASALVGGRHAGEVMQDALVDAQRRLRRLAPASGSTMRQWRSGAAATARPNAAPAAARSASRKLARARRRRRLRAATAARKPASSSTPATSSSSSRSKGDSPKTPAQWTSAGVKSVVARRSRPQSLGCVRRLAGGARLEPLAQARAIAATSHCWLRSDQLERRPTPAAQRPRRVHAGTVICCVGSNTGAGPLRSSSTLSAPSTRRRTQCGPAGRLLGNSNTSGSVGRGARHRRRPRRCRAASVALCSRRTCGRDASVTVTRGGAPPRDHRRRRQAERGIGGDHRHRREHQRDGVGLARVGLAGRREAHAQPPAARPRSALCAAASLGSVNRDSTCRSRRPRSGRARTASANSRCVSRTAWPAPASRTPLTVTTCRRAARRSACAGGLGREQRRQRRQQVGIDDHAAIAMGDRIDAGRATAPAAANRRAWCPRSARPRPDRPPTAGSATGSPSTASTCRRCSSPPA